VKFIFIFIVLLSNCQQVTTNSLLKETTIINKIDFCFKYSDFHIFYDQYVSDSNFQKKRTMFPLKGTYSDYSGDEKWEKHNWQLINWRITDIKANENDSTSIIQKENYFFYGNYCLDCGFSFEMAFSKIKGKWYLTYRQENNF